VAEQIARLIATAVPARRPAAAWRDLARLLWHQPAVRETMVALELAGLVEVRTGAGSYVAAMPAKRACCRSGSAIPVPARSS
jgi:GntR family transcriptional repressor for pyruvate dehydrogenase complex